MKSTLFLSLIYEKKVKSEDIYGMNNKYKRMHTNTGFNMQ